MFAKVKLNLYNFFQNIFPGLKHFQINGFSIITQAALKGQSLKISEIARNLEGKMSYKCKRNKVERFLKNNRIKTSLLQRAYINYLFKALFAFPFSKKIKLVVDYTDFLGYRILYASVPSHGRVFPVYFKMFSIKRKKYSLREIETVFLRTLRANLAEEYKYIVIADRGFGNNPFITQCKNLGFYFVLRVKGNMYVAKNGKKIKISTVKSSHNRDFQYKKHKLSLVITYENDENWYLFTNLNDLRSIKKTYEQRFWTEEYFRDLKTYFKSRTLKYNINVMKRLLLIGQICYNFVFEIGLKENIDSGSYSASSLSFFPSSILYDTLFLPKVS